MITKASAVAIVTVLAGASLVIAATQNDLLLTSSSLDGGRASGFVGKGTRMTGGQVWMDAAANYSQACLDGETPETATDSLTVHKQVDTYDNRLNRRGKLSGYNWNTNFIFPVEVSTNLCASHGWTEDGSVAFVDKTGKVYLSNDSGSTEMLDTVTGFPIEISLAP